MRKNVLVLGDLVTDIDMVDPKRHDKLLKVGFLNHKDAEYLLDHYKKHYDVVVTRDGPLLPVNILMDSILMTDKQLETKFRKKKELNKDLP